MKDNQKSATLITEIFAHLFYCGKDIYPVPVNKVVIILSIWYLPKTGVGSGHI